jgi:hypothetical protein
MKEWMMFALAAVALFATTVYLWKDQPTAGMTRTQASIVDIEDREYIDEDNLARHEYTYYIDYSAAGKDFSHVLLVYSEGEYKIGDKVTIYYDPANPADYRCDAGSAMLYTGIAGGVCLVLAVFMFIRGR